MTNTRFPRRTIADWTPEQIADRYAKLEDQLKVEIDKLNAELGYALISTYDPEAEKGITYGYIGNAKMGRDGYDYSDVLWYVFLPHPGRVGTSQDSIGGWKTGDLEGLHAAFTAFRAFAQGVRFARSR